MNDASAKPPHPESAPAEPILLDCDHIFAHAGGDPELLIQLCSRFLGELPMRVEAVRSAIGKCKHPAADRAVQQLRSCLMIFGFGTVSMTADALDLAIRCGHTRDAHREWKILDNQLQILVPQVQHLLLQMSTPKSAVQ